MMNVVYVVVMEVVVKKSVFHMDASMKVIPHFNIGVMIFLNLRVEWWVLENIVTVWVSVYGIHSVTVQIMNLMNVVYVVALALQMENVIVMAI